MATNSRDGEGETNRRISLIAALSVFCLICLSARFEIARLIGAENLDGQRYSANVLSSMFDVRDVGAAAQAWKDDHAVRDMLWWFLASEVVGFVTLIAVVVLACIRWARTISSIWVSVVFLWVAQLVLQAIAIGASTATGWIGALKITTYAAWLASIAFVAWFAFKALSPAGRWASLRVVGRAIGVQRFQLGVVVLLAALFVVPGPPILEQGTDVVRSWVLDGEWGTALVGTLSFFLLAVVLRYLGSVRSAWMRAPRPGLKPDPLSEWGWPAGGAALVAVLLGSDWIMDDYVRVDTRPVLFAGGVLAAQPLLSLIAKWAVKKEPAAPDEAGDADNRVRTTSLVVGRVLSASVLVVLGMSVCRSLFAPLILLDPSWVWVVVVIAVALASCLTMAWAVGADPPEPMTPQTLDNRFHPQSIGTAKPEGSSTILGTVPSVGLPSAITLMLGLAMFVWPLAFSRILGLVGTVAIALILLTLFFMSLQIASQMLTPPFVFRAMRLRRTPVTEIVLAIALLSTFFATGSSLHAVRNPSVAGVKADGRPTIDDAFKTWVGRQTDECALVPRDASGLQEPAVGGPNLRRVQPLILVAAEGGGIRAAFWTVEVMAELTETDCGAQSVFLASGVSGGAVGLGLMASVRPNPNGSGDELTPSVAVNRMAAQRGLSAAAEGLLTRDLVAGVFGLEINPPHVGDEDTTFPDRAGLMEYEWEQQIPGLDSPFPIEADGDDAPARGWHTVFNGTSVGYSCRVLIADIQLITSKESNDCDATTNEVPGAYDLFTRHPCYLGLRTTSASLMAARFPFVTPSALVDAACGDEHFADQVIDGGYAENSGIDTVNAALAQLMPRIRAHNHSALGGGGSGTVIVPLVVFAHNTVAITPPKHPEPPKAEPELFIPIRNSGASATLGDPATLLAHSTVIASTWIPDAYEPTLDSDGEPMPIPDGWQQMLTQKVHDHFLKDLAVTVAPQQKPQMALPLGWSMSSATQDALSDALQDYLRCTTAVCTTFNAVLESWGSLAPPAAPEGED